MIGHAVLDLDGTMVDSAPLCAAILNAMLADRGAARRISEDETRPCVTAGGAAMVSTLLGAEAGDIEAELAEFRRRYAVTPTPPDSLYPGVRTGLRALNDARLGVAVWSNKPQALCEKVIADLDLSQWCSAIVGTGPDVPHKPDPTGYHRALARAGGVGEASCMVGDTLIDHAAARNAGAPFVWVSYGYGDSAPNDARVADDFASAMSIVIEILSAR